jgi:hypothetical protein
VGGVVLGSGRANGLNSYAFNGTASGSESSAFNTATASGFRSFAAGETCLASNNSSTALGRGCTASGSQSFSVGNSNTSSGQEGSMCLGRNVSATGQTSISIGRDSTSTGTNSIAIGKDNSSSASYSMAVGIGSTANRYGMFAHASGITTSGVWQFVRFLARGKTTNDTPTELSTDGATARLTVISGTGLFGEIKILGFKSDGTVAASYIRKVAIKNVGGLTELIGSVESIGTDTASGTSIVLTANDTDDSLKIEVTGIASETWRWVAIFDGAELTYGT